MIKNDIVFGHNFELFLFGFNFGARSIDLEKV